MLMQGPAEQLTKMRRRGRSEPIDTPAQYLALVAQLAQAAGMTPTADPRTLEAYIDLGCWKADCPRCRSGIAIHPEWPVAACLGHRCYRVYRAIDVPAHWRDLEAVLHERDVVSQCWLPAGKRSRVQAGGLVTLKGETLIDLIRENVEHGVAVPLGVLASLVDEQARKDEP